MNLKEMNPELLFLIVLICGVFFPCYSSDAGETCSADTCNAPSPIHDEIEDETTDGMTVETEHRSGFDYSNDSPNILNEDAPNECDPNACRGEGTCSIQNGKTVCQCLPQYFTGDDCSIEVDNCHVDVMAPCDPRGTERCISYFGGRFCKCRRGYYGTICTQRHPSSLTYLHPNTLPAVYFPHTIFEDELYTFYVVFENKSETNRFKISVENINFEFESKEFKKNNKLAYYMGFENYPKQLPQKYFHEFQIKLKRPGIFHLHLTMVNVMGGTIWDTDYYFSGIIRTKNMQFGDCPPTVTFQGGICSGDNTLQGYKPKILPNQNYKITHIIQPCRQKKDEEKLKVRYFLTDIHDITKIYKEITQVISSPPLQLDYTNSIVVRVDGKYGTSYAQCFVEFHNRRVSEQSMEVPLVQKESPEQDLEDDDED